MSGLSLDQLRIFVSIVEHGSFAAAARQLNRTQSSVTYAVQKLEEQTGLELFDRDTYRPSLTKAGQSLLPFAQKILADVSDYQVHAERISQGLEANVRVAYSQFAPLSLLTAPLQAFQERYPSVRVAVTVLTMQNTQALDDGSVDLALIPEFIPLGSAYVRAACGATRMMAVAAPHHPLALFPGRLPLSRLQAHVQIVTSSRSVSLPQRNFAVHALNYWQVNDLDIKRHMILAGLGWGSMPDHLVEHDLAAGTLVALDPVEWDGLNHMPILTLVVAHRRDLPLGPAGQWLYDRIIQSP